MRHCDDKLATQTKRLHMTRRMQISMDGVVPVDASVVVVVRVRVRVRSLFGRRDAPFRVWRRVRRRRRVVVIHDVLLHRARVDQLVRKPLRLETVPAEGRGEEHDEHQERYTPPRRSAHVASIRYAKARDVGP